MRDTFSAFNLLRLAGALLACIGFILSVLTATIKLKIEHFPARGCALYPFSIDNTFRNYACYVHHALWAIHPYGYLALAISFLVFGFVQMRRGSDITTICALAMTIA
ncbi:hypothetical protein PG984_013908 [Apiospora sp. TS-2023a]